MRIIVVGASSGPGQLLFEQLRDDGVQVVGIARHQRDIETSDNASFESMDASDGTSLAEIVQSNDCLVHCSRPEILTNFLAQKPKLARLIALGSTRIYTRFPDDKCSRLTAMTHAIWMSNLAATILHPTMIYGAPGLNNIERVMRVSKLSPFIPLPKGGDALIQPVAANDVVASIRASLANDNTINRTVVVAGKHPISYRQFVEQCIGKAGNNCKVVSMPYWLLRIMGLMTHLLPRVPTITQDELERLLEDKEFATEDMLQLLNVEPMDFENGLEQISISGH